jgi:hypothetical protein
MRRASRSIWGVVAQADQLGQLLPQQGNRRFPLVAGISASSRVRGEVIAPAPAPPSHGLELKLN